MAMVKRAFHGDCQMEMTTGNLFAFLHKPKGRRGLLIAP
jgi:hypothetical protein